LCRSLTPALSKGEGEKKLNLLFFTLALSKGTGEEL